METLKVTKELEIKNAIKIADDRYLKIHHDSDYTPMEDDGQLATIVYKGGSRYNLGDKPNMHSGYTTNNWEQAMKDYFKGEYGFSPSEIESKVIWLPVYAYVHGGATISTDSSIATCPWDSGRSGFVYALKSEIKKARGFKRLTKEIVEQETEFLKGHVYYFDCLLKGEVYGFEIVDSNDDSVDSCWGFVGELSDINMLNMAQHMDVDVEDEKLVEAIEYIVDENLIIY